MTAGGGASVELVEAATELVVAAGAKMQLVGEATGLHGVTRQILGYREERSGGETSIVLTATLQ